MKASVVMLVACALLLSGCAGARSRDASAGVTILRPSERQGIHGVEGESLDGVLVDLDGYRGKVVVVNW